MLLDGAQQAPMGNKAAQEGYVEAFRWLEKAHASKNVVDLAQSNERGAKTVLKLFEYMTKVLKDPNTSDYAKGEWFADLVSSGQQVVKTTTQVTREISGTGIGHETTYIEFTSLAGPR